MTATTSSVTRILGKQQRRNRYTTRSKTPRLKVSITDVEKLFPSTKGRANFLKMGTPRSQFTDNRRKFNKKGINLKLANPLIFWCLGPDLNRHGGGPPRDFKSLASTNSATQALLLKSLVVSRELFIQNYLV